MLKLLDSDHVSLRDFIFTKLWTIYQSWIFKCVAVAVAVAVAVVVAVVVAVAVAVASAAIKHGF